MKETARKQASEIRRLLDDADLLLCQAALNGHVSSVLAAGPLVDRAVKNYSEVLKMDSRNWWALTQRGVARLIVGTDKKEVIRDFEQAERLKPGFAPLENLKTLALDRPDEKIQRIQQPTLQNLDAREAFTYGILVSQERPRAWQKDCVDLFTLCVDKEPEYLPSQVARARVRSHTEGNLDECRTLLRSKPNCAFLHLMVARLLGPWRLGKSVEAVAESVTEHEMAVQLQPWNPVCHVGLADVYGRTGNLAGAETHLKTACLLDSTAISYLDLARFYSRQQDHPRTLAACGEGLKKKHDLHCESEILEIKASCLRQLGRIEELPPCLEQWEQCLRSLAGTPPTSWNTNDMGSYYHERLLEFLWNNGRRQEARILVTDSDETHPQYQLDLGNTLCQLYGSEGDFTNAMLLSDQLFEQIMESEILDTSSEFHEAYEIITRHPRYQLILGADRSQAMSTWETILARFPENSRLWSFYGQFLERNGGHVKAVVVAFRQALRYMSNEKQRRQTSFFLAGVLQRAGNLPAAEEELRALVYKIENTSQTDIVESSIARDIYITLSNVYWAQDRTDLAIAVLEQGLKGVPSQPRLIKELAKKRALTGSTSEAIATYMSYFRALPQDLSTSGDNLVDSSLESDAAGEAMFDLTNLLLQIGNLDEAEKFLRREQQLDRKVPSTDSLSQSPNYVTYRHISWAKVYLAKGNTISALSELDSAGKLKPKSFYVWMLIANVCLSSSQWEKAQEAAKRMTELDPSSQIAHTFTGFFSQNVGDHQGAVQAFRRALTLTPDGPQKASIYMGLSLSLRSLDQLQDARNACRMATEADPNNWGVWGGLGAGCKMLHEYPESINSYERAIALAPDNPALIACYSELAALYATCPESGLRNGRKAVQLATQACEWSGHKDHRPIAALAAAYAECGDFPRAMQYQDEAISLLRGSQYSGIGVALTKADGVYTITGIGPNTPAASANIYVGDIVTAVDGQSIQGMKLTDVVDRIKGTPSTKVTLTMKHADRETAEDISILRQPITNPDLQEYEKRLREYRAGKPWREKEQ
jgi:tetratricopeptide (TPR) repeat protein